MTSTAPAEAARRRRPDLRVVLVAFPALLVLLALGTWQVQRLEWKQGLIAMMEARAALPPVELRATRPDPRDLDFRAARILGTAVPVQPLRFGTVARDGRPGTQLLAPVRLDDGGVLLVARGWLGEGDPLPAAAVEEPVDATGVLRWRTATEQPLFAPDAVPAQRRWYWWDLPAMSEAVGAPLLPLSLEPGPLAVDLPNNHLGYAITWYGLAAALVAVSAALAFRSRETSS